MTGVPGPFLIVRADALPALSALPSRCVQTVVTDPPWNRGKSYGPVDDALPEGVYVAWLAAVLSQCARVARGPIGVFLGSENGARLDMLTAAAGLRCLERLYWEPSSGVLEDVVVLGEPTQPQLPARAVARTRAALTGAPAPEETFGHPCPKPVDAVEGLVALLAPDGGTVLDPFLGSGTTLVAARRHGCAAIGMELAAGFCDAARQRVAFDVVGPGQRFGPDRRGHLRGRDRGA